MFELKNIDNKYKGRLAKKTYDFFILQAQYNAATKKE